MTKGSKFKITVEKNHAFRNLFLADGLNPIYDRHFGRLINENKTFVTRLSANCSVKNAEESFKVWLAYSAIKFAVKRHFTDLKEVAQLKVSLFFSSFIHQSNTNVTL